MFNFSPGIILSKITFILLLAISSNLLLAQGSVSPSGNADRLSKQTWIGFSPFLWEISDSKSFSKFSVGIDRGLPLRSGSSLMLGYTLAASIRQDRSLALAPLKLTTGHFLAEGRIRSYFSKKTNGFFLEGGICAFLDDSLTFKIKKLEFNLGGYAAIGFQKTLIDRVLIMPTLQYRHNDFTTRENGLYIRLGLGYVLKPKN